MKKKSRFWGQMIAIFVVGLVVSFLAGDLKLGGLVGLADGVEAETLLKALSLILAAVALILGVGYLFYRAAKKDDEEGRYKS